MHHTLLVFTFFISVSLQDKPYNFRPESRHIEINAGDTFYIGFDQIKTRAHFEHCYIKSSAVAVDYPLNQPVYAKKQAHLHSFKGFFPYPSVCAFTYSTQNNKVPSNWTITVFDDLTNSTFVEKVTVDLYYNRPLYSQRMEALQNSTAINFFLGDNTKLKKCSLRFDNTTVEIDFNSISNVFQNVFKSRLSSLGNGKCGYKINKLVPSDSKRLTLFATDANDKVYRNSSLLVVLKGEKLQNRSQEVYLGDAATIKCGKPTDGSANFDQKFCYLYNPGGDLVFHGHMCVYELDVVTKGDLGKWRCLIGFNYTMEALEFTTELLEKKPEAITTFHKNTTSYFSIGCQLLNFNRYSLRYCRFTRPDGKIFLTTGGGTQNYNTFTSDLEGGKCALEIVKPLRVEDKGTWKCEAAFYGDDTTGAFITIEKATRLPYQKHKSKNIRLGHSFVVDCQVPYSSDHCYIQAPNGTQYKPESRFQITTGLCMFKVDVSTESDNGTWRCAIARRNGIPDEVLTVEVSIIDLKVLFSNVEALEGTEVNLTCNTNGIPLDLCRFVAPSNESYSLRKEMFPHLESPVLSRMSYFGRGLEYGDCGIQISRVNSTHHGLWRCHISSGRSYRNKEDLSRNVHLVVVSLISPLTIVATLGIVVGVITVLLVAGFFLYKSYRQQRCCKTDGRATLDHSDRVSNASENSNESAALTISGNALYTTYRRQAYSVDQ